PFTGVVLQFRAGQVSQPRHMTGRAEEWQKLSDFALPREKTAKNGAVARCLTRPVPLYSFDAVSWVSIRYCHCVLTIDASERHIPDRRRGKALSAGAEGKALREVQQTNRENGSSCFDRPAHSRFGWLWWRRRRRCGSGR